MSDSNASRACLARLVTSAGLLLSAPVGAQLYATPAQPVDRIHYVTPTGIAGGNGSGPLDRQRSDVALARLTAFGECVVSHDPAGSAAYVRASVGADGEPVAYRALRVAHRCAVLSRADQFWLGQSSVRQSAIADAVRARFRQ